MQNNNANEKAMDHFSAKALQEMDARGIHKYYVYGLISPITYQPFYVGKGCGNRVFDHAKAAKQFIKTAKEDEETLKIKTITEILDKHKEVICMIYRWGLTNDEALIVEAVLIDCLPGLTNIQSGYQSNDYGMITAEDLQNQLDITEYKEPEEDYVIIKTSENAIENNGNLYEATRRSWYAKLDNAKKYKYVLSVIRGSVQEVYEVSEWFESPTESRRIEFTGEKTNNKEMQNLIGHRLPEKYMQRGAANPFMYKKEE